MNHDHRWAPREAVPPAWSAVPLACFAALLLALAGHTPARTSSPDDPRGEEAREMAQEDRRRMPPPPVGPLALWYREPAEA